MVDRLIRLTSPVSPINFKLFNAIVTSTEMKHDVASFDLASPGVGSSTALVSGLPIKVEWNGGLAPHGGVFFGYIDMVQPIYQPSGPQVQNRQLHVQCTGPSYWLKSSGYTTFKNLSADAVVRQIADKYQLACVADPHPIAWPLLEQGGKSWWAFLSLLAKRVGYALFTSGATVYFIDRRSAGGRIARPEQYRVVKAPRDYGDALQFRPTASSGDGFGGAKPGRYFVQGTSGLTGKQFAIESAPSDVFYGTSQVMQPQFRRAVDAAPESIGEAQSWLNAAVSNNMFTAQAEMMVQSNSRLRPGTLIDLQVVDGNSAFTGTWYVIEAEQNVGLSSQVTRVLMGTDSVGFIKKHPQRVVLPLSKPRSLPPLVFRAGRWVAKWSTAA